MLASALTSSALKPIHYIVSLRTLHWKKRIGSTKKYVSIKYDTNDQLIRMDVMAPDPQVAAEWSLHLVKYAEGQVDNLTRRLRESQMRDAKAGFETAQEAMMTAQRKLIGCKKNSRQSHQKRRSGLLSDRSAG